MAAHKHPGVGLLIGAAVLFVASPASTAPAGRLGVFGDWFGQMQDLAAIEAHLDQLAASSSGRARVVVIGHSIEGRAIKALRLSPPGSSVGGVLVTGTLHAREWAATMVTMGFAEALVQQIALDPRTKIIADALDLTIVPVVNVDGFVASHNGQRLQRKNLNPECGVDLNRNFDVEFGLGAPATCASESYPGRGPFSEPETQALRQLATDLPKLRLYLDYHSPSEQVMIPYAHTRQRPPHYERSVRLAQLYSSTLAGLYGTLHPAREGYDLAQGQGGGAIDWFRTDNTESFAVELRDGREIGGFELPAAQIIPTVEENWLAFRALAYQVAIESGAPRGELDLPPAQPTAGSSAGCGVIPGMPAAPDAPVSLSTLLAAAALLSRLRLRRPDRGEPPRVRGRGTASADRCPAAPPPASCSRPTRPE